LREAAVRHRSDTGYTAKTANRLRPARVAQDVASETEDVFMQGEDFYAILGVVSFTQTVALFMYW
jgi:hypothetical protein